MNIALIFLFFSLLAVVPAQKCGPGKPSCPSDKPCCSLYGECGNSIECLGACDYKSSYNNSSCAPLPICKSQKFNFENTDSIISQEEYDGDPEKYGWITNGKILSHKNKALIIMEKESYGTVLASTRAVWYGKVSTRMKTSHGAGVVSAFILMSGSKDEIDYEFIGSDLEHAQSNYYYQGFLDHSHSEKVGVSDTHDYYHTFEIDWQPEVIHWSIDGVAIRSLKREDTFNKTTGKYHFPQTPSTIYLSLWPGGSSKNEQGTISWAGGPINWKMRELEEPGYLWAAVDSISIKCYDAPFHNEDPDTEKGYIFKSNKGTETDIGYVESLRIPLLENMDKPKNRTKSVKKNPDEDKKFKAGIDDEELDASENQNSKKKSKNKGKEKIKPGYKTGNSQISDGSSNIKYSLKLEQFVPLLAFAIFFLFTY